MGEGLKAYRDFVMKHQRLYQVLRMAQRLVVKLPPGVARSLLLLACKELPLSYVLPRYMEFADPKSLKPLYGEAYGDRKYEIEAAFPPEAA